MPINIMYPGLASPAVDIVLVHGLSGDSSNTWLWLPSALWPKDFLPFYPGFDTAGIRVLSFGYDGNRQPSPPAPIFTDNDINGYSDNLLADLVPERRGLDNPSRPIIFVGHGLGGLLVKDALNKCHNDSVNNISADMAAIGKATIGVVFLSTPHRGTSPYNIWNNILLTTPPFLNYSSTILNDIVTGSPTLVRMENAFNSGVIDTLQVYTFFEEKDTSLIPPLAPSKIVQNNSARLGHRNERQQSLLTEHYFMTKFPSNTHPLYTRLASAIYEIFDNNRKGLGPDGGSATPVPPVTPAPGLSVDDLRRLRSEAFKRADFPAALSWSKQLEDRLAEQIGPKAQLTLKEKAQTAGIYVWLRNFPTALSTYNQVLTDQTATLGASHPDTLLTMAAISNSPAWQNNTGYS